eukprot:7133313-Heterocapsa_arctica.AAC.1
MFRGRSCIATTILKSSLHGNDERPSVQSFLGGNNLLWSCLGWAAAALVQQTEKKRGRRHGRQPPSKRTFMFPARLLVWNYKLGRRDHAAGATTSWDVVTTWPEEQT